MPVRVWPDGSQSRSELDNWCLQSGIATGAIGPRVYTQPPRNTGLDATLHARSTLDLEVERRSLYKPTLLGYTQLPGHTRLVPDEQVAPEGEATHPHTG